MARRLNVTITPVLDSTSPGDVDYGNIVNGTPTGILQYVYNDTVDTIAMTYGNDGHLDSHFTLTTSMFYKSDTNWMDVAWRMLRLQLLQPQTCESGLIAGKLSIIIFSLAQCAVIMGIMSSYLFSNLIKPPNPIAFCNIQEMVVGVMKNDVHIVEISDFRVKNALIQAGALEGIDMEEVFKYNPIRIASNISDALEKLHEKGSVMDDDEFLYRAIRHCDVVMNDDAIQPGYSSFVFRKNHPLLPQVNRILSEEKLEIRRIWVKYMVRYKERLNCETEPPQSTGNIFQDLLPILDLRLLPFA
ncbi:unnamed protein product [Bursaphelenchus okinawaensis]|uniref:Uncharacterized protein n=1 Tax=Bursaphelenchus okinawaensis TaxID=465554 RepID=A0A811K5I7_9BILA|nr:unnamed protein product [Bursaphelenchus okinawaensis]CAG9091763.1 unnamed protein product [Bursaphelenchus okinawaensis]